MHVWFITYCHTYNFILLLIESTPANDVSTGKLESQDPQKRLEEHSDSMDIETITSCTKCNLFFMSQAEFAAHKKLRACSRKFTCHSCGKMYTNVKLLVSHLVETKHGETVCSVCNFAVESQDDMNAHIQRHALDLSKVSQFGILRLKKTNFWTNI